MIQVMTCLFLRLAAAFPLTLALIGSAWAVPVNGAGAPFQADLPAGWVQQVSATGGLQILRVTSPGTPPPVVLAFICTPYKSMGNDAQALRELIAASEKGATGEGQATLKRLSERPLTVGGVRGTERSYTLTVKSNGAVVQTQIWYGAGPKKLLQFQAATGKGATSAQTATFDRVLSTVKFK